MGMDVIPTLKRCIPRRFRPVLRKYVYALFPSLRYANRVQQELENYAGIEEVHDLPPIAHYWSHKYLIPMLEPFGIQSAVELIRTSIARVCTGRPAETISILSIGSGNCSIEIGIAEWLRDQSIENYVFECVDINPDFLSRAQGLAGEKAIASHFTFERFDVNVWQVSRQYDVILAIQSLHHFVELEVLFDKVHRALKPDGYFISDDMIGRNGHQRWPEALKHIRRIWRSLPDKYKYNHSLKTIEKTFQNADYSDSGFEGIRAQDILALLTQHFGFELFIAFGNIIDPFIDRAFGPNFDPADESDRAFIDRIQTLDQAEIEGGRVKPTHMIAVMTKEQSSRTRMHKHLSPQFCIRRARRFGLS
jgi:SAM-dependent methyltransferase